MAINVKIKKKSAGSTSHYTFSNGTFSCGENTETANTFAESYSIELNDSTYAGCNKESGVITILQQVKPQCNLSVSPSALTINASGVTGGSISVTSSTSFSTSADSTWITVSTGTSKVNYIISANTSTSSRSGTIKIWNTCDSTGKTVSVTQNGKPTPSKTTWRLQLYNYAPNDSYAQFTLNFKNENNVTVTQCVTLYNGRRPDIISCNVIRENYYDFDAYSTPSISNVNAYTIVGNNWQETMSHDYVEGTTIYIAVDYN